MQTSAWLILLFPLAGTIVLGLGYRVWPPRVVGAIHLAHLAGAQQADHPIGPEHRILSQSHCVRSHTPPMLSA